MDHFPLTLDTLIEVSLEELHSFHAVDREIFSRLVINLRKKPGQSMLMVATWLWLEEMGYPNIIVRMRNLSDNELNNLADEALACLNCLEIGLLHPTGSTDLLLTSCQMGRTISLNYFVTNRVLAISGIQKFLNNVCSRAFADILQRVVPQTEMGEGSTSTGVHHQGMRRSLVIPGFPHQFFGGLNVAPPPMPMVAASIPRPPGLGVNPEVLQNDRTLFVTFSRGYSVTEDELCDFFNRAFGDCVHAVYMQEVPPRLQPLFARVVLRTAAMIPIILNGEEKVQFVINGKQVRVRLYMHGRS